MSNNSFNNFNIEERVFVVSKIYSSIQKFFGHWEGLMEFDLDKEYQYLLEQILPEISRKDFTFSIMELIAKLSNGHSWVDDSTLSSSYPSDFGFKFEYLDDKWVIVSSDDSSLPLGTIMVEIEGEQIEELYQKQKIYISASSERAKRSSFAEKTIFFPPKFTLKCFSPADEVIVKTIDQLERKNALTLEKPTEFKAEWIQEKEIGYIKISHFGNPDIEKQALEWVEVFFDAKTIIIDVRGHKGGSTPVKLIFKLMNRRYRWWTETMPMKFSMQEYYYETFNSSLQNKELDQETRKELENYISIFESFSSPYLKWTSKWKEPEKNCYQGNVVILIDRNTRSAGEDFVIPFKDNGRALIIGETTRGSTGEPYMVNFGKGLSVFIGLKRAYFPDGRPFEGIGIEPDISVSLTIEELQITKDSDPLFGKFLEIVSNLE